MHINIKPGIKLLVKEKEIQKDNFFPKKSLSKMLKKIKRSRKEVAQKKLDKIKTTNSKKLIMTSNDYSRKIF